MKINKHPKTAGFTLVEMLVVITIIGILAGLVAVTAPMVLDRAKNARIMTEVSSLDMAIKAFKQQYGAYPPCDLSNTTVVQTFMMQAFPRYNINNLTNDFTSLGVDTSQPHPDRALVFWLSGFSPDVTNPLIGGGTRTPLFNFDTTRLICTGGTAAGLVYVPPTFPLTSGTAPSNHQSWLGTVAYVPLVGLASTGTPYVYFDSSVYPTSELATAAASQSGTAFSATTPPAQFTATSVNGTAAGTASPYVLDANNSGSFNAGIDTFCNPTSFQIISAGQDGQFGTLFSQSHQFRLYPTGVGYDSSGAEDDNIASFSSSTTLGDAKPN